MKHDSSSEPSFNDPFFPEHDEFTQSENTSGWQADGTADARFSSFRPFPPHDVPPYVPYPYGYPKLPEELEDYKYGFLLGRGSTGSVYQVEKVTTNAVKVIDWDRDGKRENAKKEFETGSLFSDCPNVVRYLAYYENDHQSFLLQELTRPCLSSLFSVSPSSPTVSDILKIAGDVCDALTALLEKGYTHFDVTPKNIFLTDDGAKLGDFSHCRQVPPGTVYARPIGSYRFMAPEIATGGTWSGTEDIYSLGITLYALLTGGKLPFDFKGRPVPIRHRSDTIQTAFLHPALVDIISRASAYDPSDRYPSPEAFKADILKFTQEYPQFMEECVPAYLPVYNGMNDTTLPTVPDSDPYRTNPMYDKT